jgi:unsaturated rhamnogalacturonyl hydrolase
MMSGVNRLFVSFPRSRPGVPTVVFLAAVLWSLPSFLLAGTRTVPMSVVERPVSRTTLGWSVLMANSEIARLKQQLFAPPKGTGRWDYTTGLYADALIRLSQETGNPAYEKNAEATIGSFIDPHGKIATYAPKDKKDAKKKGPVISPIYKSKRATHPAVIEKKKDPRVLPGFSLDQVQSGFATLELYQLTGEERFRLAADILRRQLRHQPRTPQGGFWHKGGYPEQMWLDGLYMGEPFYAAYATRFDEPRDFDDIVRQLELVGEHTYDPKTGLFYHGWDASKKAPWADAKTGASPSFWSRALGWYAMALVDVLEIMPADHPARPELTALLQKVAHGLLKYQDPQTGVWWQVTDQGNRDGNFLEASSSCMFVYALAKGVNLGCLPRSDIPAIHAGYAGIIRQFVTVSPDGQEMDLNRCCRVAVLEPTYKGSFDYYTHRLKIVSNDLKGVGPFINAGIECHSLFGEAFFTR